MGELMTNIIKPYNHYNLQTVTHELKTDENAKKQTVISDSKI